MKALQLAANGCLVLALLGAAVVSVAAAGPDSPATATPLTLEQLYRAAPYRGEPAKGLAFSHSGRYLAYLWNPVGEPGTDLYVHDSQTNQTWRLTSPTLMAAFDAPEDLARYQKKLAQKRSEDAERQAREEGQAAYLHGAQVDLNQWDDAALAKFKKEFADKQVKDEAQKAADKADADAEKRAMAELTARRAGKPLAPSASAPAASASAASAVAKEDWEWRDELKKQQAKDKLKPSDLYPGVAQAVWAHKADELIFAYRGSLFRWQAAGNKVTPLVSTQRSLKIVTYQADDQGFVYSDESRVLAERFAAGGVQVLNRELINPDDAERKWKIADTTLSEDGRWMALLAHAPLKSGDEDKPATRTERQVEIMHYDERFATAKKVDREVSDDKRQEPATALYIRRVDSKPSAQPAPVFTQAGGDVWFEMSPVVWSKDGQRYSFATWEREKELLRVYLGRADENAKPEVVIERRGDVGHEVVDMMAPRFTPDGRSLVVVLDDAMFRQPYALDLASKKLTPLLKGDFEAHPVLGFTPDSKAMFVLANKDDTAAMNVYRVNLADGTMQALGNAPDYHRAAAVSEDGQWAAADAGNWASLPEVKLLKLGQKPLSLTVSHDPAWAKIDVLRPTRFSFKNRHGDTLQGYWFKPPGWQMSDRRPAVLYTYGGPLGDTHIVESDSFQQTAYLFGMYMAAKHGYVMVTVDARGHSNYGRKFSDANWEHVGQPQAEDLEDAKHYMVEHFGVDAARVGLTGWSFGGFQTQYTLYTKPDVFAAGIAGAGPTEWENYNSWYSGRTIGPTERSKPVLRKYSLLPLARNLKKPLLLEHGMQDPNVLFQDTVNVYRELMLSGKEALVDLFLDPEGVHHLGGAVQPVGVHRKNEAFWLAHLGEGAGAGQK